METMFLSKTIADEIRATFPGKKLEPLRLRVRAKVREDGFPIHLVSEFPEFRSGLLHIERFVSAFRPCEVCGETGHNEERHEVG
jgi:hypothetical protein